MNGRQFLEMLSRLPPRIWIQAILGLIGFVVLAVLGFAVIAGVAAVLLGAQLDPVDPGLEDEALPGAGDDHGHRGDVGGAQVGRRRAERPAQVEVVVGVGGTGQPAGADVGELLDDRAQLLAGGGEAVADGSPDAGFLGPDHQAVLLEGAQAVREQVGRDAREPSGQLAEAAGAGQEVPDDEQRPAFAQHVEGAGRPAVLGVRAALARSHRRHFTPGTKRC